MRAYRVAIGTLLVVLAALVAVNIWLHRQRERYRAEDARLRASMTALERERADAIVASDEGKLQLALELLRRQARLEHALHLSVSLDSSTMTMERDGVPLRQMVIDVGPDQRVGLPPDTVRLAAPRGIRTVERVLGDTAVWDVPEWVYVERGLAVPAARSVPGALGPAAILLDGGTIIYSQPATGPLADSTYVLPGAIRARPDDLRAIAPNILPGMRVYFY